MYLNKSFASVSQNNRLLSSLEIIIRFRNLWMESSVSKAKENMGKFISRVQFELLYKSSAAGHLKTKLAFRHSARASECLLYPQDLNTVSRWEDPGMVSRRTSLWKLHMGTWGTKSTLTSARRHWSLHEAPSGIVQMQPLFPVAGVHGLGLWAAHLTSVLLEGALYLEIISLEVICFAGLSERL